MTRGGSILIEEHISGLDVRAFVVGGRVVAAATRLPPFIVGDGHRRVSELVEVTQAVRNGSAYLRRMPIVVDDDWLAEACIEQTHTPADGEIVILNPTVNLHQGGVNVDITGELCSELQQIAVSAARAIPGLLVGGIDLLVESPYSSEGAVVLEANTKANISVHHLFAYGLPVDVGSNHG